MKKDQEIYTRITDSLVEALKNGKLPWTSGVARTGRPGNFFSKKRYLGINWLSLSLVATECPWFVTFKQAGELGWKIRKGEKGSPVVFWDFMYFDQSDRSKRLTSTEYSRLGGASEVSYRKVPYLRYSTVFNLSQVEGDGVQDAMKLYQEKSAFSHEEIDTVVASFGVPVVNDGSRDKGCYFPEIDEIHMPHKWQYDEPTRYYKTLLHELAHATGYSSRLNRKSLNNYETERPYEELVAELSAAFLCQEFGLTGDSLFDNSVAYLQSWLNHLENDHSFIFRAASDAMKAVNLILDTAERNKGVPAEKMVLEEQQ